MECKTHHEPIYMILNQLAHLGKYQSFKQLENYNLKPGQAAILFVLNHDGKLSQRELAEKIGITPPSVTVALRKLEDRGFISKEPDEKDQRIMRIFLTETGKDCVENIKGIMRKMEEVLFLNITEEERMLMKRLLLQMRDNLLKSKYFEEINMASIMAHEGSPMHGEI